MNLVVATTIDRSPVRCYSNDNDNSVRPGFHCACRYSAAARRSGQVGSAASLQDMLGKRQTSSYRCASWTGAVAATGMPTRELAAATVPLAFSLEQEGPE